MNADTKFEDYEKGKKGARAKKRKGPATHFRAEKMDDGTFVSTTTHEVPNSTKEQSMRGMYMGPPETRATHPNIDEAAAHMKKMFGGKPVSDEKSDEEKGEGADTSQPDES